MKPWKFDIVKEHSQYDEAWKDFKPGDFYFGVNTTNGTTVIYVCPKDYFESNNYLFETSIPIIHLMPKHCIETFPAMYETPFSEEETIRSMVLAGFDYNSRFQKFVRNVHLLSHTYNDFL